MVLDAPSAGEVVVTVGGVVSPVVKKLWKSERGLKVLWPLTDLRILK
jgi:hypothetical protein